MIAIAEHNKIQRSWHAVHTRSRHEKIAECSLVRDGVETFLPAVRVLSQWKDRKKWVEKPLFPGYLFVRVWQADVGIVRSTRGVVSLVGPHPYEPSPIPDEEVENLRTLVASESCIDPFPYLHPGQLVRVKKGSLEGVEGTIVRKTRKCFLVVSLEILGQSIATEIPADSVYAV